MRTANIYSLSPIAGMDIPSHRIHGPSTEFLPAVVVTATVLPHHERSVTGTLPAGWSYVGCEVDVGNRILSAASQVSAKNTPQTCIAFCSGQGYTMAGVEFGGCPALHLRNMHLLPFTFLKARNVGAEAPTIPSRALCSQRQTRVRFHPIKLK
ncbi:hypothetical protein K438DRAFT_697739 [Mycena galopus ATCC 62051]|nr:hypothetical protein K438DRAFT_697739 [Mycena galopus ATCC 62051]